MLARSKRPDSRDSGACSAEMRGRPGSGDLACSTHGHVGTMLAMSDVVPPETLEYVAGLERELQTRACRADEVRLRELLAADFVEVGASGRRWDLGSVLGMLIEERADPASGDIDVIALSSRALAPGVIQVFWDSDREGRRARRTSIWCEREDGWKLTYHQGTPLP
jgi:hypothetical protein